jgi:C4-type Zn-finger protein
MKKYPRIDGKALKIHNCPRCKREMYIDVHEYFGLPSEGWMMCSYCGYKKGDKK